MSISSPNHWIYILPTFCYPFSTLTASISKGGSKVRVIRQGGACNSAPKGPNDLKFCMQGAFVCYYWVLVKSRSCDLYRGQSHLEARTGLAIIEVAWTWLDQNSIVTHKSPLHAKFQVIWSIGDWVTGTPLSKNPDFAPPFVILCGIWVDWEIGLNA